MSFTWLLFYGRQLGMSRDEIVITRYGEMLDMITCLAIHNGSAKEVAGRVTDYEDALKIM